MGRPEHGSRGEPHPAVVGIGASAGGLAALKSFFRHVPEGNGLAWVVVVHLAPEHESRLADVLQPHVRMPVEQVKGSVALEPDRVYVIPPNANLEAVDTHLRLTQLQERRDERAPIDHFLRTLARTHDGQAVAVILTGTGSDGTLGLREVKRKGGLAIVQDPRQAEHDAMPRSALATEAVDLVLPLERIPAAILEYVGTAPRLPAPAGDDGVPGPDGGFLRAVMAEVRRATGRDFGRYKDEAGARRIARRMQLAGVEEPGGYLELLRESLEEARALGDELLVPVTAFFRDAEVFEVLAERAVPSLFEGRAESDPIRVWSVGCATGEEAYSLAILLMEEASRRAGAARFKVFASDLHEPSLARARDGFYPGEIEADVSAERLRRFFRKEDGGYRIRKDVREHVTFAQHDLLANPPFSRVHLVSCRNLLIYLRPEVQADVMGLFHYSLKPGGVLVLGPSEQVDDGELFELENRPARIYRRRDAPSPDTALPVFPVTRRHAHGGGRRETAPARPQQQPEEYRALHRRIVEGWGPPSVLVAPDDRVLHVEGEAGRFLAQPAGQMTTRVQRLVREELRGELEVSLAEARAAGEPVRTAPLPVRLAGETVRVALDVRPGLERDAEGFLVVVFDEREEPLVAPPDPAAGPGEGTQDELLRVREERDLARRRLQVVAAQHASNEEELRSANEELMSSNEELRSAMEELEASKEELQSMNEELHTVGEENRHRVEELAQLTADLHNLLTSTEIATLFLDRDLRILRFTPQLATLFNVRSADRGRPLADLTHRLVDGEVPRTAREVLERVAPVEREVRDRDGRWYLARVAPYRTATEAVEGVAITFVDITSRKHAEEELRRSKEYAETIVRTLHEPLLILTPALTVESANQAFLHHFGVDPDHTIGRLIYELGNGQWDIPALRTLLEDVLSENQVFEDFEVVHDFPGLGVRVMLLNARRLEHGRLILLGIRDVTERRRRAEAERQQAARDEVGRRMVAVEEEQRRRLSLELHDQLGQLVTGLSLGLKRLESDMDPSLQPKVREMRQLAERIGEEAHYVALELRPPALDRLGLEAAVGAHLEEWSARHGVETDLQALGLRGRRFPHVVETTAYRVVQEGLTNVARHARATRVSLLLELREDALRVILEDDGVGFDAEKPVDPRAGSERIGLPGIRERVRLLGGGMEIDSRPGGGTTLIVRLPVERRRAEAAVAQGAP